MIFVLVSWLLWVCFCGFFVLSWFGVSWVGSVVCDLLAVYLGDCGCWVICVLLVCLWTCGFWLLLPVGLVFWVFSCFETLLWFDVFVGFWFGGFGIG